MVAGAFRTWAATEPLAQALPQRCAICADDRRGDSGDAPPYAVGREIEDLAALITAVGEPASVFGYSSGEPGRLAWLTGHSHRVEPGP